MLPYAAFLQAL